MREGWMMARRAFVQICDIYRGIAGTFGVPIAVHDVPCNLIARFAQVERIVSNTFPKCTHYITLPWGTDVRDGYQGYLNSFTTSTQDTIVVHDGGRGIYLVYFVEVRKAGAPDQYLRAYCNRYSVVWPLT
jgi:hypothetical protein